MVALQIERTKACTCLFSYGPSPIYLLFPFHIACKLIGNSVAKCLIRNQRVGGKAEHGQDMDTNSDA